MMSDTDNIIHIRPVVSLDDNEADGGKKNKKINKIKIIVVLALVLLITLTGIWAYTQLQTHTTISEIQVFGDVSVANSEFAGFDSGILRYGKDGVAYIDMEGEVIWNHPYQIATPIVQITSSSAVIADSGGNQVVVLDENGVKGEFETVLPIEKVTVSEQGIVGVLTKNGSTPEIICYDATGNILVEHKTSLSGTGYPTALAISQDGKMLLVTYLKVVEGSIASSFTYYSFEDNTVGASSEVYSGERSGVVIPEVRFLDSTTSVLVTSDKIEIFTEGETLELLSEIELGEEIETIFYGEDTIAIILEGTAADGNEMVVYDIKGNLLFAKEFTGEYRNASIEGNQIILYEGENCRIFTRTGIEKFVGEMKMELSGVFPVFGVNKYIIVGNEGMKEVRLMR
ncbi:MAG: DUF5711 family protein [Eubacteriales bacterium]